ncbi:MAG: transcriptional repressor [Spirochaetaceae bacterium]|nr:transcriptional repressor [Spirochaetaceae bacterium]
MKDLSGGRKHSKKRDAILRTIRSTNSHPGAQWVYDQLKPSIPDLSLGTVYRNISLFREEGEVVSLGVVQGEERFDGRVSPHPHLVCCRCGRVLDLPSPAPGIFKFFTEPQTEGRETVPDFTIDYRKTVFYGLCRKCAEEAEKKKTFGMADSK